jgi:hypothetical protein
MGSLHIYYKNFNKAVIKPSKRGGGVETGWKNEIQMIAKQWYFDLILVFFVNRVH